MKTAVQLCVDWNNDGDYGDSGEDITAYLYDCEWRQGRDYASMLVGRATAGQLTATLKNTDGRFNSFLSSGPYYGNLVPGRPVRLWAYVTPDQLDSLHAWYKADAIGGLSAGDPLTGWEDASDNGFDAAVITAPTYRATDGPNSLPCVRFASASSQALSADGVATALTGSDKAWTVLVVMKNTTTAASMAVVSLGRSTTSTPYHYFGTNSTPRFIAERRGDSASAKTLTTGTPSTSTWQIMRQRFTGTLASIYSGGTQSGSDTDLDVPTMTVDRFGIGCLRRNTNAFFLNADVAEIVILLAPTLAEEALVECYLSNKYALGTLGLQFVGRLDTIVPHPQMGGAHTAQLTATGPLGFINSREVALAMATNVLTGTAVGSILDDAGWAAGDRSLDTGRTTMSRYWTDKTLALGALREVEETEAGFIRETKDGKIAFEDRHHRLLSPHTTSQATLTDTAGASNIGYRDPVQADPLREIYNRIEATVQRYTVQSLAVLWTLSETGANSPAIQAGESRTFWATYPNPDSATNAFGVDAWTTPVASTDYTANAAANGSGADLSASVSVVATKTGNTMKVVLTNAAATVAYVTLLQARGTPITADDPARIVNEDSTSQTAYGRRTYPNPAKFIPTTDEAESNTRFTLSVYKDPIPVLSVTLPAHRDATHLREALMRDVSDRVTIVATGNSDLGINADFFVEAIQHRLSSGGYVHDVTYECSPATAYSGFITLDIGPVLDVGRLAY